MGWIRDLHSTNPTAQAIAVLSLVCMGGMALGSISIRGVRLGTAGVLFAALLVGHFSKPIDHETLSFVKEFGLILFVFCIGLQVGPGFFTSLRQSGIRLNALALAIVAVGTAIVVSLGWIAGLDGAAIVGVLAGATTNTPSLGAGQQTLATFPGVTPEQAALPAMAYAVSYPLGIMGIIGSLIFLKAWFRVDVQAETSRYGKGSRTSDPILRRTLIVQNENLAGLPLGELPGIIESGVVISRVRRTGDTEAVVASRDTELQVGDQILAVGTQRGLDHFQRVIGDASTETLLTPGASTVFRRVLATNPSALGRTVNELQQDLVDDVVVTRIVRGETEMTALPALQIQFGDVLHLVGTEDAAQCAAKYLGDSVDALNETHFVPLFAGIAAGVAIGTLPIDIPGLPQPVRLGLAGGPLVVALLVGRIGRIGRLVWYMPRGANLALRELGIALFFAGVGLAAGPTFFSSLLSSTGALCVAIGACVTVVPLLVVGIVARTALGMDFVTISGLLAGSMTDPPALAFANGLCKSEAPSIAYAAVYPTAMICRIMTAQILTVALCG